LSSLGMNIRLDPNSAMWQSGVIGSQNFRPPQKVDFKTREDRSSWTFKLLWSAGRCFRALGCSIAFSFSRTSPQDDQTIGSQLTVPTDKHLFVQFTEH
jgi:hypothetical protein